MKILLLSLISVLLTTFVHGQWMTTTYTLKGGWNAIYLHGDASYDTIENVISQSQVLEIWRWNTSPTQVTFTDSPSKPSAGAIEWSVWKRGLPDESTLTRLTGQCGYLVKCNGNRDNTYSFDLKHSPTLPENSWVRNGANLLGFPTPTTSSNATFTNYFETFPLAIDSSAKIYKYTGGNLSSTSPRNPDAILSYDEIVDRTKAYWFSAEVTSDFYAPIEIGLSNSKRVDFGSSGNTVTLRLRNRTSGNVTVTLTPTASQAAPLSATPVAGSVPLTRKTFNPDTAEWTSTALGSSFSTEIEASRTVEIVLGIDRSAMTGSPGALFASLLRVTDSTNLMDVYLPVTAKKASLAGLWVGDIQLNSVSNKVSNPARATATLNSQGAVSGLTVVGSGGFGYVTPPTVTITPPAGNDMIPATATAGINSANRTVTSLTLGTEGFGYDTPPTVTLSEPTASVSAMFTANLSAGAVGNFTVVNAGFGYQTAPTVTISAPPSSSNATAAAVMNGKSLSAISVNNSGGYYSAVPTVTIGAPAARTTANATISGTATNWSINKVNAGSGYSTVPSVGISGGNGTGGNATATLGLTADSFTINSGDTRYSVPPNVIITNGGNVSITATANATLTDNLVTGITITNMGAGYTTVPSLAFTGGNIFSGSILPTAVGNANQFAVSTLVKNSNGSYTVVPNTVTIAPPPAPVRATATAVLANGTVSAINLTNNGTGYLSTPTVTISGGTFVNPAQATANATLSGSTVASVTRNATGAGYLSPPTVTISAPPSAAQALATANVSNNRVTGFTITQAGYGYYSAPTVTLSPPTMSGQGARATANMNNGTVTGFNILSGGSGYRLTPAVTISAPPALTTGTGTQSAFKLRTLLHVTPTGTAKLLSKAYLGALAVAPNSEGISTSEALLQTSSLGMARRFTSAHLPTGKVISASGTVALGNNLACTILLPYNDPSNPFVHEFHPDHDNKDTRFEPAPEGYESYDISRVGTFTFTTTPPNGADVPGWGSSVIGGTYSEIVTGLHSSAIHLDGTFELRRASEIGTLSE
jgi:hypothetical protein